MTFLVVVLNTRAKLTTTTLQPSPVQLPSKNFLQKLTSYSAWGVHFSLVINDLVYEAKAKAKTFLKAKDINFFKAKAT